MHGEARVGVALTKCFYYGEDGDIIMSNTWLSMLTKRLKRCTVMLSARNHVVLVPSI